jgi:glycosyltransferase involved in cell wall biosynthesis
MLRSMSLAPRRILMTLDAVGGVWRYALGLAERLAAEGCSIVLAGLGPEPSSSQRVEAERVGTLVWLRTPPDWMTRNERELDTLPAELGRLAAHHEIDLVHLNAPSQACGLKLNCPVIVAAHSCVVTWFHAVRNATVPAGWQWQHHRNRMGLDCSDAVISPSLSHAGMMQHCYGPIGTVAVIHNAAAGWPKGRPKEDFIFAAARWWDEGKNGAVLDEAAALVDWPVFAAGPTSGPNGEAITFRHPIEAGSLPHRQVGTIMARAGIFVSPSIYEPFGLAALEAALSRTPLVLADIPTYRELWNDAALFFPPRDAGALAEAVRRLIKDRSLRRRLGLCAARRARAYSFDQQLHRTLALYGSAAERAMVRG